jgi:sensor domain CHASE-containing protein
VALLISLLSAGITIVGVVLSIHSFDRSVLEDLQKQTSEMRAELSEIRTRLESTPSCAVTPTKNIRRSGTTTP